jgi:hypothetical protein
LKLCGSLIDILPPYGSGLVYHVVSDLRAGAAIGRLVEVYIFNASVRQRIGAGGIIRSVLIMIAEEKVYLYRILQP